MNDENCRKGGLYQPLDANNKEVRLLLVKAGKGDQPIVCELQLASLQSESRPQYETVSYCWGDPTQTATIILHDVETTIPLSSKVVLARIRKATQDRLIWIDAICINQSEMAERNQQVTLMKEIYSGTEQNLIWLGDGDEKDTSYVLFLLDYVFDKAMQMTNDGQDFYEIACETVAQQGLGVPVSRQPLINFFSSPWFERVWIIQEAILPPKGLVYVGSQEIEFKKLLLAATWLENMASIMNFRPLNKYIGLLNCSRIYNLGYGKKQNLADVLSELLTFKATNPRDYVYGVLGLYQRLTGHQGALPELIRPDYNKSVADVMRDATRFIIQESPNLDYLRFIRYRIESAYELTGIPSWVEPWNLVESKMKFCANLKHAYYSADNGVPMQLVEDPAIFSHNILSLGGIIVDTVGPMTFVMNSSVEQFLVLLEGERSPIHIDTLRKDPESIGGALIAESTNNWERSTPKYSLICLKWAAYILEHKVRPHHVERRQRSESVYGLLSVMARFNDELTETVEEPDPEWEKLVDYDQSVRIASYGRRYFGTQTKDLLGLGPMCMISGDVVAILYGCRWPVILRPKGDHYEFIEVCYVHGLMDGEAVEKHRENGAEDLVLHIR